MKYILFVAVLLISGTVQAITPAHLKRSQYFDILVTRLEPNVYAYLYKESTGVITTYDCEEDAVDRPVTVGFFPQVNRAILMFDSGNCYIKLLSRDG